MTQPTNDLETLRNHLFSVLEGLKNGTVTIDTARAMNEVGKTLVNTARVEVDFLKATDGTKSTFIASDKKEALPPGITGRTVHRIAG